MNRPKLLWSAPAGSGRTSDSKMVQENTWARTYTISTRDTTHITFTAGNKFYALSGSTVGEGSPDRKVIPLASLHKKYRQVGHTMHSYYMQLCCYCR